MCESELPVPVTNFARSRKENQSNAVGCEGAVQLVSPRQPSKLARGTPFHTSIASQVVMKSDPLTGAMKLFGSK